MINEIIEFIAICLFGYILGKIIELLIQFIKAVKNRDANRVNTETEEEQ